MLTTLIFYVAICQSEYVCNSYEPASWSYTNEQEREEAYKQCELLVNTFDSLPMTKESDCYVGE